jgi:hypothetical protein
VARKGNVRSEEPVLFGVGDEAFGDQGLVELVLPIQGDQGLVELVLPVDSARRDAGRTFFLKLFIGDWFWCGGVRY